MTKSDIASAKALNAAMDEAEQAERIRAVEFDIRTRRMSLAVAVVSFLWMTAVVFVVPPNDLPPPFSAIQSPTLLISLALFASGGIGLFVLALFRSIFRPWRFRPPMSIDELVYAKRFERLERQPLGTPTQPPESWRPSESPTKVLELGEAQVGLEMSISRRRSTRLMITAIGLVIGGFCIALIGLLLFGSDLTRLLPFLFAAAYTELVALAVFRLYASAIRDIHQYMNRMLFCRHLMAASTIIDGLAGTAEITSKRSMLLERLLASVDHVASLTLPIDANPRSNWRLKGKHGHTEAEATYGSGSKS